MTAEIALLNKTAVALAADSAITLSAGSDQQKIFDTEDKLFELTCSNAIGVMINSSMNFMEAPLPVLIKKFRSTAQKFATVDDAADSFLQFLDIFGRESPDRIKKHSVATAIQPAFQAVESGARKAWAAEIFAEDGSIKQEFAENPDRIPELFSQLLDQQITLIEGAAGSLPDALFVGEGPLVITDPEIAQIVELAEEALPTATEGQRARVVELGKRILVKHGTNPASTGVIVAGFGDNDLFPTLVSLEVTGMVGNRLKYYCHERVDIDRNGQRARVIPFAQREMVERFLYGLDGSIQDSITKFCREAVPQISSEVIDTLDIGDADKAALQGVAQQAESTFLDQLRSDGFEAVRESSRQEIEEMVEFMPKPELTRMAEALVNLTSIKRRVTRGFETVGGAIDVAVISQGDGFVWVKRKHYFPPELNSRYFKRIGAPNE